MNSTIHTKTISRLFTLITIALLSFQMMPLAHAVSPPPDGGYPGGNTAEGQNALLSLTTGTTNTAAGANALLRTTDGSYNAGFGYRALENNIHGSFNMAVGTQALLNNTGSANVAVGFRTLYSNNIGHDLTGIGTGALYHNTTGIENTAIGSGALATNTHGGQNTAIGVQALSYSFAGGANTAVGYQSLQLSEAAGLQPAVENTAIGYQTLQNNASTGAGVGNTAVGSRALQNNQGGSYNIAVGFVAGSALEAGGSRNIYIGNVGAGESSTIRIGNSEDHQRTFIAGIRGVTTGLADVVPVLIDSAGQLGTISSSARFKKEIKPMNKASETVLALKPVTFHYKGDKTDIPQFGLIAEEVAKVNPDLVVRDKNGEIYTVRYDAVNAMLLNEFLKEHRKVEKQEATIAQLKKEVETMVAHAREQDAQIQRVRDEVRMNRPDAQTVASDR